jgi:ribose-phosphate pyrophosphokinase
MELLLMVSTLRRSSANKITAVIPYYGYARQDRKMMSRVPISAADVAKLLETMGVDRVIACDLHCGQIQGFFGPRVPVDNLECSIVALNFFRKINLTNPVVVSPDAGGVYRAKKFQSFLNTAETNSGLAMIIKQRLEAGKIEQMDLVGIVNGCDCIIVDDIIDTAGTLCQAAEVLKKYGAKRVFAFATHGLFSRDAISKIENSPLDQVIITNTIPLPGNSDTEIAAVSPKLTMTSGKIKQISVGLLVAEAIRRAHLKESFEKLFYPKSFEGDS